MPGVQRFPSLDLLTRSIQQRRGQYKPFYSTPGSTAQLPSIRPRRIENKSEQILERAQRGRKEQVGPSRLLSWVASFLTCAYSDTTSNPIYEALLSSILRPTPTSCPSLARIGPMPRADEYIRLPTALPSHDEFTRHPDDIPETLPVKAHGEHSPNSPLAAHSTFYAGQTEASVYSFGLQFAWRVPPLSYS